MAAVNFFMPRSVMICDAYAPALLNGQVGWKIQKDENIDTHDMIRNRGEDKLLGPISSSTHILAFCIMLLRQSLEISSIPYIIFPKGYYLDIDCLRRQCVWTDIKLNYTLNIKNHLFLYCALIGRHGLWLVVRISDRKIWDTEENEMW